MNLLTISKEIKKINISLDYLKNQQNTMVENINTNYDLMNISDEIKNNISDIYSKLEQIYNFNITSKFNNETKNYNDIEDFLKHLNIDNYIINKIIFLDFNSLNDILLTDDDIFEKNDIPKDSITYIKNKIQEELYVVSLDI
tara:strand:- start:387 stop:812 length:426 start_codon:yes stop_codon:yes gene_type:complete